MAQVSVNITDYQVTAIHEVYEEIVKEAKVRSLRALAQSFVTCANTSMSSLFVQSLQSFDDIDNIYARS